MRCATVFCLSMGLALSAVSASAQQNYPRSASLLPTSGTIAGVSYPATDARGADNITPTEADRLERYTGSATTSTLYDSPEGGREDVSPGDRVPASAWEGGDCGYDSCCDNCRGCWYGGLSALIMTRDRPNEVWLTYPNASLTTNLMSTQDSEFDWVSGWEVTLGRRFGCHHAIEARLWGLDEIDHNDNVLDTTAPLDDLRTPLDFGTIMVGGGLLGDIFDFAREHRVARTNQIYSAEINLVSAPLVANYDSGFGMSWFLGGRYFRFDERLAFSSVDAGFDFGDDPTMEATYAIDVENNLYGFQVGSRMDWMITRRLGLYATPRVGVYANDIDHRSQAYRHDMMSAFDISSSKEDVALMAELDLGLNYQVSPRWRAYAAYRAVGISGVALSDDQIPQFIEDVAGITDIDSSGEVILHGAVIGAEYNY